VKKELRFYQTISGKTPFLDWLESIKDHIGKAHITNRLNRIVFGNFGDCKWIGDGIRELRIHYGPGYRVYFTEQEDTLILLLFGGDKRSQSRDIKKAKLYWADFRERCYD